MATQVINAIGASRVGCGISSVMCVIASYPINERADCNKPSIQATPSGQPVSLVNRVKTNSAFVLGAVARMTADVAIQAVRDQNTARSQTCELSAPGVLLMGTLTSPFIPFPQKAIPKDVQTDREERDGEKVHVRMPRRELHRVIRPGNDGSGDELGFVWEVLSVNRSSERDPMVSPIGTHHQKQLRW
jgi:hypothetical protein